MPSETGLTENTGTPAPPSPAPAPAATPAPSALGSLTKAAGSPPAASSAAAGDVPPPPTGATTPAPAATPGAPDYWDRIPEPRRNVILENARKEERERLQREYTEKYSWVDGHDRAQVEGALRYMGYLSESPWEFYQRLGSELRQHPQYRANFEEATEEDFPGADLYSEPDPKTGQRTEAWSRKSVERALEIHGKRLLRQMQEQIGPIRDWAIQRQEEADQSARASDVEALATETMSQAEQLPYFKEHKVEIGKRLGAMNPEYRNKVGTIAALYMAYNSVLKDLVLPGLSVKAEQDARDQLTRKATAAVGTVHPVSTVPASGVKKPTNPTELAAHIAFLAGQGQ